MLFGVLYSLADSKFPIAFDFLQTNPSQRAENRHAFLVSKIQERGWDIASAFLPDQLTASAARKRYSLSEHQWINVDPYKTGEEEGFYDGIERRYLIPDVKIIRVSIHKSAC